MDRTKDGSVKDISFSFRKIRRLRTWSRRQWVSSAEALEVKRPWNGIKARKSSTNMHLKSQHLLIDWPKEWTNGTKESVLNRKIGTGGIPVSWFVLWSVNSLYNLYWFRWISHFSIIKKQMQFTQLSTCSSFCCYPTAPNGSKKLKKWQEEGLCRSRNILNSRTPLIEAFIHIALGDVVDPNRMTQFGVANC